MVYVAKEMLGYDAGRMIMVRIFDSERSREGIRYWMETLYRIEELLWNNGPSRRYKQRKNVQSD